jgi:hypothetical protein
VGIDPPCTQVVTGVHDGPLTAGAGGLCLDHATVDGSVTVSGGGRLIIQGSTVRGAVRATDASVVALCGSEVSGPTTLTGTTGNVSVGDTVRGCDPDTLAGPLSIEATRGRVVVDRTEVTGPVAVTDSHGSPATVLSGVIVHGPLSCAGNAIAPTDSAVPATVDGPSRGQCAALG